MFLGWNYWWQAHLLDCLIDAQIRDPQPARIRRVGRLIRSIRGLNAGRWTNDYYDDMAWLGLALQRTDRTLGTDHHAAVRQLSRKILLAWSDAEGGGIPWRRGDAFKNTPANGPAAILLARTGHPERAAATAAWIDHRLRDPYTGLIWDGLRPGDGGQTVLEKRIYSYCQGVVLGAELELAECFPASTAEHAGRIQRLVAAVDGRLTTGGVLTGHQGGDSGLFTGILARYLALVAARLPGHEPATTRTRDTARTLILRSAEAAHTNAAADRDLPVFGADWTRPAILPTTSAAAPERDLSVQLSGWMLLEAAHAVTRHQQAVAG